MKTMNRRGWLAGLLLLGAATLLPACETDDGHDHDHGTTETFTVTAAFDEAAKVGKNTMTVTVKDSAGAAVSGAAVTVDPQMPMMGHGSIDTPVVTDNGDGTYKADPVTLQMSGKWVITVKASKGSGSGEATVDQTL
ncbi:MAG: FixH family protein [Deltaproteobacteria bacterium]|nr:FixH family protein [Deltaproteobacteria bacterium]